MNGIKPTEAIKIRDRCQRDPVFHVEEIQGCASLEPFQKKVIEAIRDHERVAVSACHDVGKTFTMAKIVLWFASSFPNCKVITTAPTARQVELLLWSEIRSGFSRSKYPLGGEMLTTRWKIDDEWYAVGFSPSKNNSGGDGQGIQSSFQGFHAEFILVVFDEATGIPKVVWDQAEGMMTSGFVRFVAIANPTSRASEFFKCFKDPFWKKIYLSCFDSPNLAANGIHNIDDLVKEIEYVKTLSDHQVEARLKTYKIVQKRLLTLSWVVSKGVRWGVGHPLFISKVLGRFPDEDANVLFPLAVVEDAQARHEQENRKKDAVTVRSYGVDPARYGPDDTVITCLDDHYQTLRKRMPKMQKSHKDDPAIQTVNFIINHLKSVPRVKREVITIDGTGLGSAIVSGLILALQLPENASLRNVVIKEIHFGAQIDCRKKDCDHKKCDKADFANLKAKIFKCLETSMKLELAILPEAIYLEEMPTIVYGFTTKGQTIIESKDDYKVRTGLGSPDDTDSLALANFGRVDTGGVGEFSEKFTKSAANGRTLAPGLKSGDNW
jgi:hypothetical protein